MQAIAELSSFIIWLSMALPTHLIRKLHRRKKLWFFSYLLHSLSI
jgi:hypothetical protein